VGLFPRFNAQFSLKDEKDVQSGTFLQAPAEADINAILAVVSTGHRCGPQHQVPQRLLPALCTGFVLPASRYFAKDTKALVVKAFDGTLLASIKDEIYLLREVEKRSSHSKDSTPSKACTQKEEVFHACTRPPWRTSSSHRRYWRAISPNPGRTMSHEMVGESGEPANIQGRAFILQ
jgi:hypothetical protein